MARIVIVDDDADFGELTRQRLEGEGYAVSFHSGAFGCINALRRAQCEVVILDVNMPALKGTSLIQLIRETGGLEKTKVLLCSSMDPESLRELARETGAHGWISKSAGARELVLKIKALLSTP